MKSCPHHDQSGIPIHPGDAVIISHERWPAVGQVTGMEADELLVSLTHGLRRYAALLHDRSHWPDPEEWPAIQDSHPLTVVRRCARDLIPAPPLSTSLTLGFVRAGDRLQVDWDSLPGQHHAAAMDRNLKIHAHGHGTGLEPSMSAGRWQDRASRVRPDVCLRLQPEHVRSRPEPSGWSTSLVFRPDHLSGLPSNSWATVLKSAWETAGPCG